MEHDICTDNFPCYMRVVGFDPESGLDGIVVEKMEPQ